MFPAASRRQVRRRGFTIIEILIVIFVVTASFSAILTIIDPVKIIHDARDAKRQMAVKALLDAVKNYDVDSLTHFAGDTSSGSAAVIPSDSEAQVVVASTAGIDCGNPAAMPVCPQLPPGYSLNTDSGLSCVARLDEGVAAPATAPTAVVAAGTGLAAGTYQYAVTFVTATGESQPSPVATVTTTGP